MLANTVPPKSQRSYKATYRRLRVVSLVLLCFTFWVGMQVWNQVGKLKEKEAQFNSLKEQKAAVLKMNEQAKKEIERLNDPEYLGQKIRRDLNYTKDGETIFIAPKSNP